MDSLVEQTVTSPPSDCEAVFRALSDQTRQKLLQLLLLEELNVSELVHILDQPQSTISRHLKVLREARLVTDRREGTIALHSAAESTSDCGDVHRVILDWLNHRPISKIMNERLQRALRRRDEEGNGFFERMGNKWDELRTKAFGEAFAFEAFLSLLPREWTVADLGAGTGYLLPALADHFAKVIAVEPASAMLECARQRAADHKTQNVSFHLGSLTDLPLDNDCCDLGLAFLVLHHIANPTEAIAEMFRVVRPGGRILIVEQYAHENRAFFEKMRDKWWGFESSIVAEQVGDVGFANVRLHTLATTHPKPNASLEAPGLFALTADRPLLENNKTTMKNE